jgi:hypothetical protein
MEVFPFYIQSEKQRNVGRVRYSSHVIFGKNFSGEKGSVRRCVLVMQGAILLSPKFGEKSSSIFKH